MNLTKKSFTYFVYCLFLYFGCIAPVDALVLTDNELTISVGNQQSWTGVNGTGNLSYYGCDRQGECVYLTGGKMTCRDRVCVTKWRNKNFSYLLSSPITENNLTSQPPSTLTILSGDRVITKKQLYPKAFDNINP